MLAMNDQVDTLIIIITNEHIHEKIAVKQLKAKKIFQRLPVFACRFSLCVISMKNKSEILPFFFYFNPWEFFLYKNKGQNIKLTLNTEVYMDIFFHFSRLAAKRYQQLTNTSSITLHLCVCKLEK